MILWWSDHLMMFSFSDLLTSAARVPCQPHFLGFCPTLIISDYEDDDISPFLGVITARRSREENCSPPRTQCPMSWPTRYNILKRPFWNVGPNHMCGRTNMAFWERAESHAVSQMETVKFNMKDGVDLQTTSGWWIALEMEQKVTKVNLSLASAMVVVFVEELRTDRNKTSPGNAAGSWLTLQHLLVCRCRLPLLKYGTASMQVCTWQVQQVCKYAYGKYSKYAKYCMWQAWQVWHGMVWYGMATPAPAKERSIKEYSIFELIQKPPYTPHINMLYTVKILQDPVQYQLHKTYQSMHNTWPECNQSLRKENTSRVHPLHWRVSNHC